MREQEGTEREGKHSAARKSRRFLLRAGKRLLWMASLLFGVSVVSFFLLSVSPLDPLTMNVGQSALGSMSPEQRERLEAYWQVDRPMPERFCHWGWELLHGNLGESLLYRRPVTAVIGERAMASLGILLAAWLLSGVCGVLLGMTAGYFRNRWPDRLIRGYCLLTSSTPAFWAGLLLLLVFGVWLGILPVGFQIPAGMDMADVSLWDRIRHGILPVLTLSLTGSGSLALQTRIKMIEVMEQDFILFAKVRGERSSRIFFSHGLRNVLLPALTLQFASVSEIFGGSVLAEQVFSYPGLGQAAVAAGLGSDVPLLMGIVLFSTVLVSAGNLAADLLQEKLDPRVRREEGQK